MEQEIFMLFGFVKNKYIDFVSREKRPHKVIARKSVGARTFAFVHERDPDSDHFSVCVAFLISVSEESNRIYSGKQLLYLLILGCIVHN